MTTHKEMFGKNFPKDSSERPVLQQYNPDLGTTLTFKLQKYEDDGTRTTLSNWLLPGSGGALRIRRVGDEKNEWKEAGNQKIVDMINDMGLRNNDYACFPVGIVWDTIKLYGETADFDNGGRMVVTDQSGNQVKFEIEATEDRPLDSFRYTPKQSGSNMALTFNGN